MATPILQLPIVEPGLLMVNIGPTLVVHLQPTASDEVYQLHLDALAWSIDQRVNTGPKVSVLYDVPDLTNMSAQQRKKAAEMLDARREKLRITTSGYALATPSAVVRGVLRAVFWLAPPPYAHAVVDTSAQGFEFLARQQHDFDPQVSESQYRALLARHRSTLGGSPRSSRS